MKLIQTAIPTTDFENFNNLQNKGGVVFGFVIIAILASLMGVYVFYAANQKKLKPVLKDIFAANEPKQPIVKTNEPDNDDEPEEEDDDDNPFMY